MPIELYICKQRDFKERSKMYEHFSTMLSQTKAKNYTVKDRTNRNNFIVMSESEEIANGVINGVVGNWLQ